MLTNHCQSRCLVFSALQFVVQGICMLKVVIAGLCVGSLSQLILVSVLNCLYDSVSHMLRKNVEKRALIDNMDGIFLAIDEICDNG